MMTIMKKILSIQPIFHSRFLDELDKIDIFNIFKKAIVFVPLNLDLDHSPISVPGWEFEGPIGTHKQGSTLDLTEAGIDHKALGISNNQFKKILAEVDTSITRLFIHMKKVQRQNSQGQSVEMYMVRSMDQHPLIKWSCLIAKGLIAKKEYKIARTLLRLLTEKFTVPPVLKCLLEFESHTEEKKKQGTSGHFLQCVALVSDNVLFHHKAFDAYMAAQMESFALKSAQIHLNSLQRDPSQPNMSLAQFNLLTAYSATDKQYSSEELTFVLESLKNILRNPPRLLIKDTKYFFERLAVIAEFNASRIIESSLNSEMPSLGFQAVVELFNIFNTQHEKHPFLKRHANFWGSSLLRILAQGDLNDPLVTQKIIEHIMDSNLNLSDQGWAALPKAMVRVQDESFCLTVRTYVSKIPPEHPHYDLVINALGQVILPFDAAFAKKLFGQASDSKKYPEPSVDYGLTFFVNGQIAEAKKQFEEGLTIGETCLPQFFPQWLKEIAQLLNFICDVLLSRKVEETVFTGVEELQHTGELEVTRLRATEIYEILIDIRNNPSDPKFLNRLAQEASLEKPFKPAPVQAIKKDPGFQDAISFVCEKTKATIYFESHQGKHVEGSWPGYNKKKDDVFSAQYLTRNHISDVLKKAWKTLDPSLENKGGYWHVETNNSLDKDNDKQMTILTFQWKLAGENAYWMHCYPNHFRKAGRIDAYLNT